ncbi:MAG: tetratricopeptide repeat protein [Candidatus Kapabacteria bacterium]|jgi:tetratricopeptide (TPR) repeat protein|nr:tetratricopeptide repeat protein [Candidatus Kapabacteria bacterium]
MKKIVFGIIVIILNISALSAKKQGQELIDSLISELSAATEDSVKLNLLTELSFKLYSSDPDKGIEYAEEGLVRAKDLHSDKDLSLILRSLGTNYWSKGIYDKALEFYFKALELNEKIGDKDGIARSLGNCGMIYSNQGNNIKALEFYEKALKINNEIGNKERGYGIYTNMGVIYKNLENFQEALTYFNKGLKICYETSNKKGLATSLYNVGGIYQELAEFDKALEFYEKSRKISEEIGDSRLILQHIFNLALFYFEQGKIKDSVSSTISASKHYKKALNYALQTVRLSVENNISSVMGDAYQTISEVYEKMGDYKKSLVHFKKFKAINDIRNSKEVNQKISNLSRRYQNQQQKREAEKVAEIKKGETEYRNTLQYSGIFLLVLALFVVLFFMNKLNFTQATMDALMFLTFLLFYEFILVMTEPFVDEFTNNIPVFKLGINLSIALLFIPFHSFEKKLRTRIHVKPDMNKSGSTK